MIHPFKHYSFLLLAGQLLVSAGPAFAAELAVDSGPGSLGPLRWSALTIDYRAEPSKPTARQWQADLRDPLLLLADRRLLFEYVQIDCRAGSEALPDEAFGWPGCRAGQLSWKLPGQVVRQADLSFSLGGGLIDLSLAMPGLQFTLGGQPADLETLRLNMALDDFELSDYPELLALVAGLDVLSGSLSGQLEWSRNSLRGSLGLMAGAFDGFEGRIAGDGLALSLMLEGGLLQEGLWSDLSLQQSAGEWLVGSIYLPEPAASLSLETSLRYRPGHGLDIDALSLIDPQALRLSGRGRLVQDQDGWGLADFHLESLDLDLAQAWPRWIDGPAAAAGFGQVQASGRIELEAVLGADGLSGLDAVFDAVALDDQRRALALAASSGTLELTEDGLTSDLALAGITLYGLPFGPSRLRLAPGPEGIGLLEPLRLPLLDGAVVIDRLTLNGDDQAGLQLDARIEPVDLRGLTALLDWPEFGGTLAGEFPGLRLTRERLDFAGGIDIDAFSGEIRIEELAIERPFGTLPALSAQLSLSRLDLLELTGAFNFGRMEGLLSGWAHGLRLLDWRPVAMDARLYTHEDAPRRRISQRAVDNLSSLGGGMGGALISGTILSIFEDFPYRRAGLACRLSNNICHVDGVARHESGGFYIVEGRLLPRLDIIGHRRLVDWPQLLTQLQAATGSE